MLDSLKDQINAELLTFFQRVEKGGRIIPFMDEPITPLPLTRSRPEQIFPTLTPAQIRRIAAHGQRRKVRKGEILVEQGTRPFRFSLFLRVSLRPYVPGPVVKRLLRYSVPSSSPAKSTRFPTAARWRVFAYAKTETSSRWLAKTFWPSCRPTLNSARS